MRYDARSPSRTVSTTSQEQRRLSSREAHKLRFVDCLDLDDDRTVEAVRPLVTDLERRDFSPALGHVAQPLW